MSVYYNEYDAFAALWLRELMKAGEIPDGEIDTRSIELVQPDDVRGFTQCHFFAGIGGWALAGRLAGWPDDRPLWTGSCPCQPFSSAGSGDGENDPRHLWPAWFRIIRECRPVVLFGEQVENAIGHGWLDLVFDDLEAEGYATGALGLPAACVGAFHRRQRIWFVADAEYSERRALVLGGEHGRHGEDAGRSEAHRIARARGAVRDAVVDAQRTGLEEQRGQPGVSREAAGGGAWEAAVGAGAPDFSVADTDVAEPRDRDVQRVGAVGRLTQDHESDSIGAAWRDVDWLYCLDGKARPVESGTFPLAHGIPARVGRLRGYGNAIVPQLAAEVLKAYLDLEGSRT